jgi:hypothetical protein
MLTNSKNRLILPMLLPIAKHIHQSATLPFASTHCTVIMVIASIIGSLNQNGIAKNK